MKSKILLHTCCAPCLYYPLCQLEEKGFEVSVFWYNPNIHGWREYNNRRMALGYSLVKRDTVNIIEGSYDIKTWFEQTSGLSDSKDRCRRCYRMRLEHTASKAAEMGMDFFSTTLLYSKFQNYDHIVEEGMRAASSVGINFYRQDFRVGWKEGIKESKEKKVYRQEYCGCIYSEIERYI